MLPASLNRDGTHRPPNRMARHEVSLKIAPEQAKRQLCRSKSRE